MNLTTKKNWPALFFFGIVLFSILSIVLITQSSNVDAAATSFRFVVMGDTRGSTSAINESVLRQLMTNVKGLNVQPKFILVTGDLVNGGADVSNQLTTWKNVMDDYYPMTSIYPALGNHEHDETVFSNTFQHLPSNQLSGYQRSAYYFDYGNTRIITLNSDRRDTNGKYIIDTNQRTWLKRVLENNGMTHNIVQFHVPAYPIGHHYGRSLDANALQRDALWDILDANNVTAVMVGHEHNYNRRKIDSTFNGNGYKFGNTIYQLTIGGGGAPLSSTNTDPTNVVVGPIVSYQYTVVDIADGKATFTTYDINNNLLDSFTVNRGLAMPPGTITTSFQNGVYPSTAYSGTIDTYLSQSKATTNYGSAASLEIDGDAPVGSTKDLVALLQWDVSSIPSGQLVSSASISLSVSDPSIQTYELYEMKRDWSESSATWNQYRTGFNWTAPGSSGSMDRNTAVLGTIIATNVGEHIISLNTSGLALVQSWINQPETNKGIIIVNSSNTNGMDIRSSEYSTASSRPKLNLAYHSSVSPSPSTSPSSGPTPKPTPRATMTTTSFQNGISPSQSYAGSQDTYLSQNKAATNFGTSPILLIDGDEPVGSTKDVAALMKWDISSIPQGITITSAAINLYVSEASTQMYELYELKRSWSESGATWNRNISGISWEIPGANGQSDRGTTVLGTLTARTVGHHDIVLNFDGKKLLQAWINKESVNHGFIIMDKSNTNGLDLRSSEYSAASTRPKLTISYN